MADTSPECAVIVNNLRINGMPVLDLSKFNTHLENYLDFFNTQLQQVDEYQKDLQKFLDIFNAKSGKKRRRAEEDEGEDTENGASAKEEYSLHCVGGWPLAVSNDNNGVREYTKWGLPKFFVYLKFDCNYKPSISTTIDKWKVYFLWFVLCNVLLIT